MFKIKSVFDSLYRGAFPGNKAAGAAISFDDAYVDDWYSLKNLFNEYGAKVTFFVSNFDLLPRKAVEKLKILQDDGHEIAFHGLRHLSSSKFVAENSLEKYLATEILPGIEAMSKSGFTPATFSYPYGVRSPKIDSALLKYFTHLRGVVCAHDGKKLTDLRQIYYGGGRRLVFGTGIDNVYGKRVEEIYQALAKARDTKKILLLFAHRTTNEAGDYCTPVARMEAVLKYAAGHGLKFYRIKDL